MLKRCVSSEDYNLWLPIFNRYLSNLNTINEQVKLATEKLNSLPINLRQQLTNSFSESILRASYDLRSYLPNNKRINTIVNLIEEILPSNKCLDIFLDELRECLKDRSEYDEAWNKIPKPLLLEDKILSLVPLKRRLEILVEQLEDSCSYETTIYKIAELLNSSSTYERSSLLAKIPSTPKAHEKILPFLPVNEQLEILIEQLLDTNILHHIETIVSQISLKERHALISKFPDWIKEIPSIRSSLLSIPTAASRPDAPEAERIRLFVAERGIDCLCHFTTIENLQGICRAGGLLSNPKLRNSDQQYNQIDTGRNDGRVNHLCCSISSYNFMYHYHARLRHQTKCWVLLAIRPDYLWKQGTLFCKINAASASGAYIKEGFASLQNMFSPEVTDIAGRLWTRQNISDKLPTCRQAEVLVYESISLDDAILIWVNEDPGNEQMVREVGWKGEIRIWPGLFK